MKVMYAVQPVPTYLPCIHVETGYYVVEEMGPRGGQRNSIEK